MMIAVPKRKPASNATEGGTSSPDRGRERCERALDEGLEETFPASDPVAAVQPKPKEPGTARKHHQDEF